ncbi:hypothetical protein PBRA_003754 [Plasmodiophora brassicae]|uniref:Transmembrane protein 107 n=1 Tax=Plasmodiophora brassicae TaxID=37360 RepID=A0A0G4II80_PLABS|nr:hypothetical protein PBRA_003754 [Plasmodiophora brassicae]
MGIESTLLPTRFLLTTVHLMAILTLFNSKDANIRAALPISYTTVQYSSMNNQMLAALWIAVVCFIVEYLGMFSGVSIMKHAHNSFCMRIRQYMRLPIN